jgi:hypothetical protein
MSHPSPLRPAPAVAASVQTPSALRRVLDVLSDLTGL